jgi:hypothetical protein
MITGVNRPDVGRTYSKRLRTLVTALVVVYVKKKVKHCAPTRIQTMFFPGNQNISGDPVPAR